MAGTESGRTSSDLGLDVVVMVMVVGVAAGVVFKWRLHRLVRNVALALWQQFLFCCCAVNLRLHEMDEGVTYVEEMNWGLN